MKAITLTPWVSRRGGGLFESVRGLTNAVADVGKCTVEVLALKDRFTDEDVGVWSPTPVTTFDIEGPQDFGYSRHLVPALAQSACSEQSVVHVHGVWMYPTTVASRVNRMHGIPFMVSPHGMLDGWAIRHSWWKKRLAMALYERANLRRARCIRALCDEEHVAIRRLGISNPICVIPNGVQLPEASEFGGDSRSRGNAGAKKRLLYLGRIHPKKNLQAILAAWARCWRVVPEVMDEWQLVIAGWDQGGHEASLRQRCVELGVCSSVSFVGPKYGEAKRRLLETSTGFVLPSLSEGVPMSILEAWSYQLPVLMTPECNLLKAAAVGAALVCQSDVSGLEAGLLDFLRLSDGERRRIGIAGRAFVAAKYAWPVVAEEMQQVYEWMLGGGSSPSTVLNDG